MSNEMAKYGTHSCTCDGCEASPIVGFRYKCTKCKDHDICETCYEKWKLGIMVHENKMNPNISKDAASHAWKTFADGKSFQGMTTGQPKGATQKSVKKQKPNDKCACGSGGKFKKCCGNPAKQNAKTPDEEEKKE